MKKERALGSIPTFDNVAIATEDLDLFKEEPKKDNKKEKEKELKVKEDLKKQILEEAKKQKEELKKETKQTVKDITEEQVKKTIEKAVEVEKVEEKEEKEPSTKKGLKAGYKRQTFVIREDLLEMIQALCSYNNIKQAELLEAFIEKSLEEINKDIKEKALASFRKEQNKDKQAEAKKEIAKLFN